MLKTSSLLLNESFKLFLFTLVTCLVIWIVNRHYERVGNQADFDNEIASKKHEYSVFPEICPIYSDQLGDSSIRLI